MISYCLINRCDDPTQQTELRELNCERLETLFKSNLRLTKAFFANLQGVYFFASWSNCRSLAVEKFQIAQTEFK